MRISRWSWWCAYFFWIQNNLNVTKRPTWNHTLTLFSICCTKRDCTHWRKFIKHTSPIKKYFWGIFIGISQHQKGYPIYARITQKIVSSHDVVFDETFSSALAYTSNPYSEAIAMRPAVSYIPYATSYHDQTGHIINFAQFWEGVYWKTNVI